MLQRPHKDVLFKLIFYSCSTGNQWHCIRFAEISQSQMIKDKDSVSGQGLCHLCCKALCSVCGGCVWVRRRRSTHIKQTQPYADTNIYTSLAASLHFTCFPRQGGRTIPVTLTQRYDSSNWLHCFPQVTTSKVLPPGTSAPSVVTLSGVKPWPVRCRSYWLGASGWLSGSCWLVGAKRNPVTECQAGVPAVCTRAALCCELDEGLYYSGKRGFTVHLLHTCTAKQANTEM